MSLLMLEPDRLAELAGYLRSGAPLAEHERALAATVLEDAALRCRPALAARLRQEALRTRNGLVYELGRLYFPDGSVRARAPPRFRTPATVRASSKRSRRTAGSSTRSGDLTWPRSASPRRAPTRLPWLAGRRGRGTGGDRRGAREVGDRPTGTIPRRASGQGSGQAPAAIGGVGEGRPGPGHGREADMRTDVVLFAVRADTGHTSSQHVGPCAPPTARTRPMQLNRGMG